MFKYLVPIVFTSALLAGPKVTFEPSGARLGDHLITYLHAKWISYRYGIPFVFHPFLYSEAFAVGELETPIEPNVPVEGVTDLSILLHPEDKIYQIYYVPECKGEYANWFGKPYIDVDWDDPYFIEWVRPCLEPRIPLKLIDLPKDKVTVALHIRRPYGVDGDMSIYQIFPYKFLPDQFYIDQLRWIYNEMGRKPLYVYIFSNDPKVKKIAATLQMGVKNWQITFDYPRVFDESREAVISDLFSMMHFDCIIRPSSNLSIVASKFGYQKLVISPEHVTVKKRGNVVDRVKIERR